MTPEAFLARTTSSPDADGYSVTEVELPSGPATISYQGRIRWRCAATKLNLCTVASTRPQITADDLSTHISESIGYAKKVKGTLRGFQSGVSAIPVLASTVVTSEAVDLAMARPPKGFAAINMPVVVDLTTGQSYAFSGRLILGAIYTSWLRERMMAVLTSR